MYFRIAWSVLILSAMSTSMSAYVVVNVGDVVSMSRSSTLVTTAFGGEGWVVFGMGRCKYCFWSECGFVGGMDVGVCGRGCECEG